MNNMGDIWHTLSSLGDFLIPTNQPTADFFPIIY